jgi:alanine racemase
MYDCWPEGSQENALRRRKKNSPSGDIAQGSCRFWLPVKCKSLILVRVTEWHMILGRPIGSRIASSYYKMTNTAGTSVLQLTPIPKAELAFPERGLFPGRPIWAEVSLAAVTRNLAAIRRHLSQPSAHRSTPFSIPKVLCVVKANAYGLGAVPIAKALATAGADWFGVTCPAEGAELRESGIELPILVLTGFWPGEEKDLLKYDLTPAITSMSQLRDFNRAASTLSRHRRIGFHLKIDTGMNRLGVPCKVLAEFVEGISECKCIKLTGTFTHLASSEDLSSPQNDEQLYLFSDALGVLKRGRIHPGLVHIANSAAVAARPDTWSDMVRPGAALFGHHNLPAESAAKLKTTVKGLSLEPVLSLRSRIISLRDVPRGQRIGYNGRFVTQSPSRIAVIAAGYADGILRNLSNNGRVIVRGVFVPIVGNVSMDLTAIDVSAIPDVQVGDVATIYGRDGVSEQSPADVAKLAGTVTQDVFCAVARRVPRFYHP